MDPVLDCLALEAPDVLAVGEVVQPVLYCLAAGSELALDAVTMVRSHPQALGSARAGSATCRAPPSCPRPPRPTRCARSPQDPDRGRTPPSARGSPPAATGRSSSPRTSRTIPATRPASDGSLPRRGRAGAFRRAARPRPLPRVLGGWGRARRVARLLPGRLRVRRNQPHPHRVTAAAPRHRQVHVLPRHRRPRWPTRRSSRRSRAFKRHAEMVRVLGSFAT